MDGLLAPKPLKVSFLTHEDMVNIFIKTFGCSLNNADSERIAGLLSKAGFTMVGSLDDADLVIVNTCTVKQPTQAKVLRYLQSINKPIVVAGCMSQATPELVYGFSMIGTSAIDQIVSIVEETLNGNTVMMLADSGVGKLSLPSIRRNPVVEIVPISEGCVGSCSYCIVRHARGSLKSYTPDDILSSVRAALRSGVKEVWLTGQDTGCYGMDIGSDLAFLLRSVASIPGNFRIRVGMMNPDHVLGILPSLIELYKNEKVFKFLHLPLQSGNDEILSSMKRGYSVKDFCSVVDAFRNAIPEITISTDIICGFPAETKEQFLESVELVKKIQPDVLNISRFWPRPKTEASLMEELPGEETKDRSRHLSSVFDYVSFEQNRRWRGWKGDIIIDESGKDSTWVGRNYCYKPVIVAGDFKLGDIVRVHITNSTIHDLRAVRA